MATTRRRRSAALAAAIAILGATAGAATSVSAATPAPPLSERIVPIAGDSQLLVFGTKISANTVRNYPIGSNLLLQVLTKSGRRHTLVETDPEYGSEVSVTGEVVAVVGDNNTVHWWDFANGTHGTYPLGQGDGFVGAAPNGFVYEQQEGDAHLIEQTIAGKNVDLGDPIDPDQVYDPITGSGGLLAVQDDPDAGNGQTAYMRWSQPGAFRPLHTMHGNRCTDIGTSYAACYQSLLPLNGGKLIQPKKFTCNGLSVVFHNAAVWTCGSGRLRRLSASAAISSSPRAYADQQVVHAFNHLIVGSVDQSKLLSLTSINAKPRLVLKASTA